MTNRIERTLDLDALGQELPLVTEIRGPGSTLKIKEFTPTEISEDTYLTNAGEWVYYVTISGFLIDFFGDRSNRRSSNTYGPNVAPIDLLPEWAPELLKGEEILRSIL